ncbi:MAG: hypothetical protein N2489_03615 [Clostridia bacterium]|nr:hypothetical protein [Clostridia bacterium]
MEPLEILLGAATFSLAVRLKKPLRKAAVFTASAALMLADRLKTTAYSLKEEIEDIVAEAHYENMQKNMRQGQETQTNHQETNGKEDET